MGRLSTTVGKGLSNLGGLFSFPDLMILGGLALLGYGLHLYSEPLAYAVVGGLVFLLGLLGAVSESAKSGGR